MAAAAMASELEKEAGRAPPPQIHSRPAGAAPERGRGREQAELGAPPPWPRSPPAREEKGARRGAHEPRGAGAGDARRQGGCAAHHARRGRRRPHPGPGNVVCVGECGAAGHGQGGVRAARRPRERRAALGSVGGGEMRAPGSAGAAARCKHQHNQVERGTGDGLRGQRQVGAAGGVDREALVWGEQTGGGHGGAGGGGHGCPRAWTRVRGRVESGCKSSNKHLLRGFSTFSLQ